MEKICIGIVDDQKLFRESLATLISTMPNYELVMQAENGVDCLEELKTISAQPDIILLDLEMPIMDGIELNEQLQKYYPDVKKIILSVFSKERLIARMINAGANGYLIKNCDKEELFLAIHSVYENGFYMNAQVMKALQNSSALINKGLKNLNNIAIELSVREKEILQYICKEYQNAEIANELFISIRTVEGHRKNLLQKIGCKNTAGLTLFAVKHKIYELVF